MFCFHTQHGYLQGGTIKLSQVMSFDEEFYFRYLFWIRKRTVGQRVQCMIPVLVACSRDSRAGE